MSDRRSTIRVAGSGESAPALLRRLAEELERPNRDQQADVIAHVTLTHPEGCTLEHLVAKLLHRGGVNVEIVRSQPVAAA